MEPKKVFFINIRRNVWVDVAMNMTKYCNWDPCYWVVSSKIDIKKINNAFPGATVQNERLAIRGISPRHKLEIAYPVVDEKLSREYSTVQMKSILMMDMLDPEDAFPFYERNKLFHRQLTYWLGVVDAYKPELVVFTKTPHQIYDFVLYHICKKKMIRTVLFQSSIMGRVFLREDFENDFPILNKYNELLEHNNEDNFSLDEEIIEHVSRLKKSYKHGMPYFMKKYFK